MGIIPFIGRAFIDKIYMTTIAYNKKIYYLCVTINNLKRRRL